jgi:hypothetical protein
MDHRKKLGIAGWLWLLFGITSILIIIIQLPLQLYPWFNLLYSVASVINGVGLIKFKRWARVLTIGLCSILILNIFFTMMPLVKASSAHYIYFAVFKVLIIVSSIWAIESISAVETTR